MVLKDTNKKIYLNSGHHLADPGHVTVNGTKENEEVMKIRDFVVKELKYQGFKVEIVSDNLNLRESIALINILNGRDLNGGLAIDIHLNAHGSVNQIINGTEVYSGTSLKSREIANTLSRNIAKELGTENSGYRPDTWTAAGSLGWIRQTNMWACVVEVCYLTDPKDFNLLMNGGHTKAAKGLVKGICELYGLEYLQKQQEPREEEVVTLQKRIMELAMQVVSLMQKLLMSESAKENKLLSGIYEILK